MFEKKLENMTRGIKDGAISESASNPELMNILLSLSINFLRLATIITATTTDSTNQNQRNVDSSESKEEPDQSSQAKGRRIQEEVKAPPQRQVNKGSLCRLSTDSSCSEDSDHNMAMVTECGHLVCPLCIEEVREEAEEAGVKALCPDCGKEMGVLRKVYL